MTTYKVFTFALLALLLISGYYVRAHSLSYYYLNNDEALDLTFASTGNLLQYIKMVSSESGHPFLAHILNFIILKFTADDLVLRLKSVLLGVITIYLFYLAGEKAAGRIAGLFMAYIAAYGQTLALVSELARQYAQFMLLLALMLIFFIRYFSDNNPKTLIYLAIINFLNIFTYYSALLPAIAVTMVIFCQLVREKKWRQAFFWAAANGAMVIAAKLYMNYQNAYKMGMVYYAPRGLVKTPLEWLHNLFDMFGVFSFDLLWLKILLAVLFAGGLLLACKNKKWRPLGILVILLLALNTILMMLVIFPFSPSRYCLHLLPFFAVIMALPLQALSDKIPNRKFYIVGGSFIFILLCLAGNVYFARNNFFRNDIIIFNLTRDNFLSLKDYIDKNISANDAIIAEGASANYFVYPAGFSNSEILSNHTAMTLYQGRPLFFNYNETYPRLEHKTNLRSFVRDISRKYDLRNYRKIWYFRLGWQTPMSDLGGGYSWPGDDFKALRADSNIFVTRLNNWPSGMVFSMTPEKLLQFIE